MSCIMKDMVSGITTEILKRTKLILGYLCSKLYKIK